MNHPAPPRCGLALLCAQLQALRRAPRWAQAAGLVLALILAAGLVTLYRVDPAHSDLFPACIILELTGLYCPGCGATRALHLLLHGRLAAALAMNPLVVITPPLGGLLTLYPQWANRRSTHYALIILALAFVLLRNVPLWPFNLLAPHNLS